MTQLSDTQAVILSTACAREGGLVLPLTTSLTGGAVNAVLGSLIKKGLIEPTAAEGGAPIWQEGDDGTPLTLRATPAAYAALGIETDVIADVPPATPRRRRDGSKQEMLISMLKRPEGASIEEICSGFDWQPHTVRGAIAGTLKMKLGLAVISEKVEGRGRVYRLDEPAE
ncbi:conserved protein of unknown function [Magnetospirillum sp. XM-1]|uniref:DUF3489 domain-containing protein n=1 Tax=Magnetospirillum sp. XM-1 TaxID=1663591 RepID=UPI00073DF828|nr:DUF3489 domain-containing protein [Magnetospirillum sp. XM-1]CUW37110.1 conserved protein of unknown function [Magnetospirillum sp. XM-1]